MGFQILDGTGKGNLAQVDADNRILTKSFFESDFDDAISNREDGYTLSSTFATGGSDIEVMSIKNTSTSKILIIDTTEFSSTVATLWTLFKVTSGTAAGTVGTPVNMNVASGKTAQVSAFANASVTGTLAGTTLAVKYTGANSDSNFNTEGIFILNQNDELAITASASGTVAVTMYFHFR